jgi:hypothetical protein
MSSVIGRSVLGRIIPKVWKQSIAFVFLCKALQAEKKALFLIQWKYVFLHNDGAWMQTVKPLLCCVEIECERVLIGMKFWMQGP